MTEIKKKDVPRRDIISKVTDDILTVVEAPRRKPIRVMADEGSYLLPIFKEANLTTEGEKKEALRKPIRVMSDVEDTTEGKKKEALRKPIRVMSKEESLLHSAMKAKSLLQSKRKLSNKVGDSTEKYATKDIAAIDGILDVVRIGQIQDKTSDIKYKCKGEDFYRGVQVKTLTFSIKRPNTYSIRCKHTYNESLLIIGYSQDRTKFLLIFSENIPTCGGLFVTFNCPKSKYVTNIFTDKNLFLTKLAENLKRSREYVEDLSMNHAREQASLMRLKALCEEKNLSFEFSSESGSVYDVTINNFRVQHKTTSRVRGNMYKLSIRKYGKTVNGNRKPKPYSDKDKIDFVVAEIITEENNFYFIPRYELINRGIFKSAGKPGVTAISMPPHEYSGYSKYKWILAYRNNWDVMSKPPKKET